MLGRLQSEKWRYPSLAKLRLAPQNMVIMLGKAMGLVAHVLQQSQGERMSRKTQWLAFAWQKHLFFLLGERNQRRRRDFLIAKGGQRRVELSFAAVDQQNVG